MKAVKTIPETITVEAWRCTAKGWEEVGKAYEEAAKAREEAAKARERGGETQDPVVQRVAAKYRAEKVKAWMEAAEPFTTE